MTHVLPFFPPLHTHTSLAPQHGSSCSSAVFVLPPALRLQATAVFRFISDRKFGRLLRVGGVTPLWVSGLSTPLPSSTAGQVAAPRCRMGRSLSWSRSSLLLWEFTWSCSTRLQKRLFAGCYRLWFLHNHLGLPDHYFAWPPFQACQESTLPSRPRNMIVPDDWTEGQRRPPRGWRSPGTRR